jgi:hypothetical protein
MITNLRGTLALGLAVLLPATAQAGSPWLPATGEHQAGLSYILQQADDFYPGSAEAALPTELELQTFQVDYAYGINDRLALDLSFGWAESDFLVDPGLAPDGGLDGLTDARVGLRWLAFDQYDGRSFTLALSAAALIAGDYDTGAITAIGDGEDGFELSLLTGRSWESGFTWQGEIGFRQRGGAVPNEWYFRRTLGYTINDRWSARVGWQTVDSRGDLDIGGPGFSPARFPEVEEDYDQWTVGLSVALGERVVAAIDYGRKFDGRNTARSDVLVAGLGFSW